MELEGIGSTMLTHDVNNLWDCVIFLQIEVEILSQEERTTEDHICNSFCSRRFVLMIHERNYTYCISDRHKCDFKRMNSLNISGIPCLHYYIKETNENTPAECVISSSSSRNFELWSRKSVNVKIRADLFKVIWP